MFSGTLGRRLKKRQKLQPLFQTLSPHLLPLLQTNWDIQTTVFYSLTLYPVMAAVIDLAASPLLVWLSRVSTAFISAPALITLTPHFLSISSPLSPVPLIKGMYLSDRSGLILTISNKIEIWCWFGRRNCFSTWRPLKIQIEALFMVWNIYIKRVY